jgi:two-component system chemotaxis response regulator CheY
MNDKEKVNIGNLAFLLGGKSVLVVDDHLSIRRMIRSFLMQNDIKTDNILMADDGDTALEIVEDMKEDLGFVLLDLGMPRLSGMEVLKKLRSDNDTRNIPVLIVTAETQTHIVLQTLENGANGYLTKPFSANDLAEKVRNILKPPEYVRQMATAEAFIEQGKYLKAQKLLEIVLAEKPGSPGVRMLIGVVHERLGEREKAQEFYEDAVSLNPRFLKAINNLASFHIQSENHEEALKALRRADEISPDMPDRKITIGKINLKQGNVDEAKAAFKKAVEIDPDRCEEIASIYMKKGDTRAATEFLNKSVAARKRYGELSKDEIADYIVQYNKVGIQFRKDNKWEEAIESYKSALEVDHSNVILHYNLGKAYMKGRRIAEAKKYISLAGKLNLKSDEPDKEITELVKKVLEKLNG